MIQSKPVFSSFVDKVTYDDATQQLAIEYTAGGSTTYQKVPSDVASKVFGAESIGAALHEHVRGQFQHVTVKKS
jgi:hypothetical protein